MSGDELEDLAKNIAENGLRQAIVLWTPEQPGPNPPQEVYLLDGRNRLEAIDRAFARDPCAGAIVNALCFDPHREGGARLLYGDTDPWAAVVSLNILRRHLTREQRNELAAALLKARPERSDRETAKLAKVSDKTVGAVRQNLEATAEIPQLHERTGADGKVRPARRSTVNAASKPREPAAQARAKAISNFSTVLRRKLADTLDDLTHLLRDEASRIAQIPHQKRVALARSYLQTLGISLDDLSADDARVQ